jgi:hypothetical protein
LVRWDADQQVDLLGAAVGGDDLARLGPKIREREQRVEVDDARGQHVGDLVADRGRGDRHRYVLRGEEVDLHLAADPLASDERLRQEGGFVGRGRALERHRRDQDPDRSFAEVFERGADPRTAIGGVEVVGHLLEARHRLGR